MCADVLVYGTYIDIRYKKYIYMRPSTPAGHAPLTVLKLYVVADSELHTGVVRRTGRLQLRRCAQLRRGFGEFPWHTQPEARLLHPLPAPAQGTNWGRVS